LLRGDDAAQSISSTIASILSSTIFNIDSTSASKSRVHAIPASRPEAAAESDGIIVSIESTSIVESRTAPVSVSAAVTEIPRASFYPDFLVVTAAYDHLPIGRRSAGQVFVDRSIDRRDPDPFVMTVASRGTVQVATMTLMATINVQVEAMAVDADTDAAPIVVRRGGVGHGQDTQKRDPRRCKSHTQHDRLLLYFKASMASIC
jgi:hypothetical protein